MRIILTYRGKLPPKKSRGVSPTKAALRSHFHPQIKAQVEPLLSPTSATYGHMESTLAGELFRSPAHHDFYTAVELNVLMLVPSTQRSIGDADNRLKTLVDGLTRPANPQMMVGFERPVDGEPTYCLLDDDALVTGVSIDVRPWFDPTALAEEAFVIVTAQIVRAPGFSRDAPVNNLLFLLP